MKERPILFSGPMVRAILEGRKTMTRRVVKPQPPEGGLCLFGAHDFGDDRPLWHPVDPMERQCDDSGPFWKCPYGTVGDRLWVRETWGNVDERICFQIENICYLADGRTQGQRYRPSIFMPRWASRLTLEITSVRVERVNEITEEDAKAEGCDGSGPVGYIPAQLEMGPCRYDFCHLWDSINSKRGHSWDSNPWVWVVGFRRVQ